MAESPRNRIAEIVQDYADGQLDSLEDAVDAIVETIGGDDVLALAIVKRGPDIGEKLPK